MKKKAIAIIAVVLVLAIAGPLIKFGPNLVKSIDPETQAAIDGCKEQRIADYDAIRNGEDTTEENLMKQKIYRAWAEWVPDYEGWLKWSDGLYLPDATIIAIGGEQSFRDYQASMKEQRDTFTMEMGPIKSFSVEGNVVDITYYMYLIPKSTSARLISGPCRVTEVHELNTFVLDEATGEMMVSKLVLTTKGTK